MASVRNEIDGSIQGSDGSHPRILLVAERLPGETDLVSRLIAAGADVRCASAAREAALAAINWRPELVLLVVRDSLRVVEHALAELHAFPSLRALRVALVGSRSLAQAPGPALRLGVDRVLGREVDAAQCVAWARGQCWRGPTGTLPRDLGQHSLALHFDAALERMAMELRPIVALPGGALVARAASLRLAPGSAGSFESLAVLAQEVAGEARLRQALARRIAAAGAQAAGGDLFVSLPAEAIEPLLDSALAEPCGRIERWVVEIDEDYGEVALAGPQEALAAARLRGARLALASGSAGGVRLDLLADLRPEFLKLAPELLRGVARDPRRRRVLAGLLGLCEALGAVVIASEPCTDVDRAVFAELGGRLLQRATVEGQP